MNTSAQMQESSLYPDEDPHQIPMNHQVRTHRYPDAAATQQMAPSPPLHYDAIPCTPKQ